MWTLANSMRVESSMPGMSVTPTRADSAAASAHPAVESWSVSATVPRPAAAAARTSSAGVSVPSETLECV